MHYDNNGNNFYAKLNNYYPCPIFQKIDEKIDFRIFDNFTDDDVYILCALYKKNIMNL
jgi:hypothetical protein